MAESSPSLPAIRERAEKADAAICAVSREGDRAFRMSIPPHPDDTDMLLMAVVREDVPALLSLVARLQGEREELEKALVGLSVVRVDGRSCWCEEEWLLRHAAEGHTEACRAARAALGEE